MKTHFFCLILTMFTFSSIAQVITIKVDTTQFFEHSALMSTTKALATDNLVYLSLYKQNQTLNFVFDLPNKKERFNGLEYDILEINKTNNILDVIVDDSGVQCLMVCGATDNGGTIFIVEYLEDDLIKGFFCNNPIISIAD